MAAYAAPANAGNPGKFTALGGTIWGRIEKDG